MCTRESNADRALGFPGQSKGGASDTEIDYGHGAASIRGKPFWRWAEYTTDFKIATGAADYRYCDGDSNALTNQDNTYPTICDPLLTSQRLFTSETYNDVGPNLCNFLLPNTYGAEPSEVNVYIDGPGRSGFDVSVRFDGRIYFKWAATAIEVYWVNEAKSTYLFINAPPDDITGVFLRTPTFSAPVGVRQTVMARLVVMTESENLAHPMGPFSPWAVRHFTIPKAHGWAPRWIGTDSSPGPGWLPSSRVSVGGALVGVNKTISALSIESFFVASDPSNPDQASGSHDVRRESFLYSFSLFEAATGFALDSAVPLRASPH